MIIISISKSVFKNVDKMEYKKKKNVSIISIGMSYASQKKSNFELNNFFIQRKFFYNFQYSFVLNFFLSFTSIYLLKSRPMIDDENYKEWITLKRRIKLSIPHLLAIAIGNFAPGLIWNIYNVFSKPFLDKLNMGIIGENLIFLPGCIIGLFVGLIVGAASDRVTFKYGRRRIFIVLGIFPTVIGLCGIAFYDKISKNGSKYIFVASVILMCFGINLIQGPSRALCSDVTPISQQKFHGRMLPSIQWIFSNCFQYSRINKYKMWNIK